MISFRNSAAAAEQPASSQQQASNRLRAQLLFLAPTEMKLSSAGIYIRVV